MRVQEYWAIGHSSGTSVELCLCCRDEKNREPSEQLEWDTETVSWSEPNDPTSWDVSEQAGGE